MNRIDDMFSRLRRKKEKALIAFLTVGFPTMKIFLKSIKTLVDSGVDLIELGIPFSDPLADGPTIQATSQTALKHGVTMAGVLTCVTKLRNQGIKIPFVLMTYYNPVFHYGISRFCRQSSVRGVDGVIVPDCPPEEAAELVRAARTHGLATIFMAAPTSPQARLKKIVELSRGFIYTVSITGVTGVRRGLSPEVADHVRAIKRMTKLPVCVGFGISKPEHVRKIPAADGVIVGSALLDIFRFPKQDPIREAAHFVRRLKNACLHK